MPAAPEDRRLPGETTDQWLERVKQQRLMRKVDFWAGGGFKQWQYRYAWAGTIVGGFMLFVAIGVLPYFFLVGTLGIQTANIVAMIAFVFFFVWAQKQRTDRWSYADGRSSNPTTDQPADRVYTNAELRDNNLREYRGLNLLAESVERALNELRGPLTVEETEAARRAVEQMPICQRNRLVMDIPKCYLSRADVVWKTREERSTPRNLQRLAREEAAEETARRERNEAAAADAHDPWGFASSSDVYATLPKILRREMFTVDTLEIGLDEIRVRINWQAPDNATQDDHFRIARIFLVIEDEDGQWVASPNFPIVLGAHRQDVTINYQKGFYLADRIAHMAFIDDAPTTPQYSIDSFTPEQMLARVPQTDGVLVDVQPS